MESTSKKDGDQPPDLGKLPHFGEILPTAGDKNYGMGKFPECSLYKGKFLKIGKF